jgi:hypothetical protein
MKLKKCTENIVHQVGFIYNILKIFAFEFVRIPDSSYIPQDCYVHTDVNLGLTSYRCARNFIEQARGSRKTLTTLKSQLQKTNHPAHNGGLSMFPVHLV